VWGTNEHNVYAVGNVKINDTSYSIMHWDGNLWQISRKSGIFQGIYGFTENNIWAVRTSVNQYNSQTWSRVDEVDSLLHDEIPYLSVWETSSSNLYLGNVVGTIIHWNGDKASLQEIKASEPRRDIWGLSENEIDAIAGNSTGNRIGELYLFDGISWKLIKKDHFHLIQKNFLVLFIPCGAITLKSYFLREIISIREQVGDGVKKIWDTYQKK